MNNRASDGADGHAIMFGNISSSRNRDLYSLVLHTFNAAIATNFIPHLADNTDSSFDLEEEGEDRIWKSHLAPCLAETGAWIEGDARTKIRRVGKSRIMVDSMIYFRVYGTGDRELILDGMISDAVSFVSWGFGGKSSAVLH